MRTPKQTFFLLAALWAGVHVTLSALTVWAYAAKASHTAEILTYFLIAWPLLMAISLYGELRNAKLGTTDNANVAWPSLGVIAGLWMVWQMTH